MRISVSITITLIVCRICLFGQTDSTIKIYEEIDSVLDTSIFQNQGYATWHFPAGFASLVELYKKENYREPGLDGYRIQVFSDGGNNAKERAQKLMVEINESHPDIPVYLSYQQPNFKVRCGNFRTKAEAKKYQTTICKTYPGCFIVKDLILIIEPDKELN